MIKYQKEWLFLWPGEGGDEVGTEYWNRLVIYVLSSRKRLYTVTHAGPKSNWLNATGVESDASSPLP